MAYKVTLADCEPRSLGDSMCVGWLRHKSIPDRYAEARRGSGKVECVSHTACHHSSRAASFP